VGSEGSVGVLMEAEVGGWVAKVVWVC
jgi:hypothetical protein